jgi:hypothetical protein
MQEPNMLRISLITAAIYGALLVVPAWTDSNLSIVERIKERGFPLAVSYLCVVIFLSIRAFMHWRRHTLESRH